MVALFGVQSAWLIKILYFAGMAWAIRFVVKHIKD